jgi:dTDP-4-dehydrorhamnose reductase
LFGASLKFLVTGAYGFLGEILSKELIRHGHTVFRQGRGENAQVRCDLSRGENFRRVFRQISPDVTINLIAQTDVDYCEVNPSDAFEANTRTLDIITDVVVNEPSTHLIHVSTDQVYSGIGPHSECVVAPQNVYAITKYAGELLAGKVSATILRTNFVGPSPCSSRLGLSDWIVHSLRMGEAITLLSDVRFSPLHVTSVSKYIEIASRRRLGGIFNLGSKGSVTKAEFGLLLASKLSLPAELIRIGVRRDLTFKATRPGDMSMEVSHFESSFNCVLPSVHGEIQLLSMDYEAL